MTNEAENRKRNNGAQGRNRTSDTRIFNPVPRSSKNRAVGRSQSGKGATPKQICSVDLESAFDLLPGPYDVVYADPAWHFKLRSEKGSGKSASQHYQTMSLDDIKALPVEQIANKDAVLFMWTTGPHLPQSFEVMEAWGFKFSAVAFVWVKKSRRAPRVLFDESCLHWGMGYTTRQNAEFVLLGRRGSLPATSIKL